MLATEAMRSRASAQRCDSLPTGEASYEPRKAPRFHAIKYTMGATPPPPELQTACRGRSRLARVKAAVSGKAEAGTAMKPGEWGGV